MTTHIPRAFIYEITSESLIDRIDKQFSNLKENNVFNHEGYIVLRTYFQDDFIRNWCVVYIKTEHQKRIFKMTLEAYDDLEKNRFIISEVMAGEYLNHVTPNIIV